MNKKIVLILGLTLIVAGTLVTQTKKAVPSETFIEYSDPSGFAFSYSDNLSLTKSDIEDTTTYADINLSSKEVSGSLNFKITDSKFKSLDEWIKLNKGVSKEVQLGNLKALEVKLADRLLMGALDQGVLFTIEMPLVEEDFWMKVYSKILADFSFVSPQEDVGQRGSDEVIFEGEEVVE